MAATIPMWILGVLTIASAFGVVLSSKPLHSALWLVLTFFLMAGHFALLEAHFLAAIQVLVYAGAIMVLVVFVLMLLGSEGTISSGVPRGVMLGGGVLAIAAGLLLGFAVIKGGVAPPGAGTADGSTAGIAKTLFGPQIFAFEAVSLLILAGIVGAVALGHEPKRPLAPDRGLRAMREKQAKQQAEEAASWNS